MSWITLVLLLILVFVVLKKYVLGKAASGRSSNTSARAARQNSNGSNNSANRQNPSAPRKRSCFSADTRILTATGNLPIQLVKQGDYVLAVDKKGTLVLDKVVYVPHGVNNTVAQFVCVCTEDGGKLNVTPDHFVYTSSRDLVPARNLVVGDKLVRPGGKHTAIVDLQVAELAGVYDVFTEKQSLLVANGFVASPCCETNVAVQVLNVLGLLPSLTPIYASVAGSVTGSCVSLMSTCNRARF